MCVCVLVGGGLVGVCIAETDLGTPGLYYITLTAFPFLQDAPQSSTCSIYYMGFFMCMEIIFQYGSLFSCHSWYTYLGVWCMHEPINHSALPCLAKLPLLQVSFQYKNMHFQKFRKKVEVYVMYEKLKQIFVIHFLKFHKVYDF